MPKVRRNGKVVYIPKSNNSMPNDPTGRARHILRNNKKTENNSLMGTKFGTDLLGAINKTVKGEDNALKMQGLTTEVLNDMKQTLNNQLVGWARGYDSEKLTDLVYTDRFIKNTDAIQKLTKQINSELEYRKIPVMSEQQYLSKKGYGDITSGNEMDKSKGMKQVRTVRGQERHEKQAREKAMQYYNDKQKIRAEYKSLLNAGKVREPRSIENTLKTARGHSDNQSTQASRRIATKLGYDWKTGKPLK